MVQRFSANRADDTFNVSTLPRRPGSTENFIDIHDCDLCETHVRRFGPDLAGHIEALCRMERLRVLLCRPFGRRMSRHIKVHNASSIMCKYDEDKQDFKPDRVDGEEVD